ncbi:MAG: FAD-dependent oxidoreductase [Aristaeellaceae bacterium]
MADFPSWQQGLRQQHPPLRGTVQADVAIVGGGLTGVTTAWMLQAQGVQTVLLEARQLGQGATFGCGGIVTCQAFHACQRASAVISLEAARALAQLLREAVQGVRELAQRPGMACSLSSADVYAYAETSDDLPALERLLTLERRLGLTVAQAPDAGGCPFPVARSAVLHHQAVLSPLPYLMGLAEEAAAWGLRIYEKTPVTALHSHHLQTPGGIVMADRVLLCTGVPLDCHRLPVLHLLQPRLWETRVLRYAQPLHTAQFSVQADEMTLRGIPDGLLMTIDRGALGTPQEARSGIFRDRTLHALLPEATTMDIILRREVFSRDGLPLIGPVQPRDDRLLMASGLNGLGLTGSYLAARILTGLVLSSPLPESGLFRPFRSYPGRSRVQREGLAASGRAYLRGWTHRSIPRCPHMGCPLRYNPANRRWECPCHGSTFDVLGQVEAAPAIRNAPLSPRDRP